VAGRRIAADAHAAGYIRRRGDRPMARVEGGAGPRAAAGQDAVPSGRPVVLRGCNKETLRNAYQRFQEDGIIEVTRDEPQSMRIADAWLPTRDPHSGKLVPEGKLWNLAEAISQSRREGKNRRDGNTVLSRVLTLVDVVGIALWEDKLGKSDANREKDGRSKKRRRNIQTGARL
jgi:hypothetical protein